MTYLLDPEDEAYICPHCGGDEPIIEWGKVEGSFWKGAIKCGVCLLSYKKPQEFIPIEKYRVLKDWVDNRKAREAEAQKREAAEQRLGVEIDALFEASYNEKVEEFFSI